MEFVLVEVVVAIAAQLLKKLPDKKVLNGNILANFLRLMSIIGRFSVILFLANPQHVNKTILSDDYRRPMSWFKSSDDAVIGRFKLNGMSIYDLLENSNEQKIYYIAISTKVIFFTKYFDKSL